MPGMRHACDGSAMRRRLFTFAAGASAVLCAGFVAFWVRSYWVGDALFRVSDVSQGWVMAGRGLIMLQWSERMDDSAPAKYRYWAARPPQDLAVNRQVTWGPGATQLDAFGAVFQGW